MMEEPDAPELTSEAREVLARHAEATSKLALARAEYEKSRAELLRSSLPAQLVMPLW